MKYKLKHLSKYCCKPANELEFEAVKMAAELGGVNIDPNIDWEEHSHSPYLTVEDVNDFGIMFYCFVDSEIPVLEFCNKLRMTEEEAEKLEDDRVQSDMMSNWDLIDNCKTFKALDGYKWRLSDDCKEVYLVRAT